MTAGPYRADGHRRCPACGEALIASGAAFVCSRRDCGEWIELAALRGLALGRGLGEKLERATASRCPSCYELLAPYDWGGTIFELCADHGVWIATRFRSAFNLNVAEAALVLVRWPKS